MTPSQLACASVLAFAATSAAAAPRCQDKAVAWATALEEVFGNLEGIAQGDNDASDLATTLVSSKTTTEGVVETFRVDSGHINEDGDSWTVRYEVRVLAADGGCYLKTYKLVSIK
jgi:hypothetical protein